MEARYFNNTLIVFLLLFVLFFPSFTLGQSVEPLDDEDLSPYIWTETMVNYTTIGPGIGIKVSLDNNRHQFHVRGIIAENRNFNEQTWEFGFLYGRGMQIGNWQISGATGAAVIGGYRYSDLWGQNGAEPMDTMIGFPLEGQIYWAPVSFAGIGVYTFANINTAQPMGGIGLSLKVGHIR